MHRLRKDVHAIHLDEADRHVKPRRVPFLLIIIAALAVVGLLEWTHRLNLP